MIATVSVNISKISHRRIKLIAVLQHQKLQEVLDELIDREYQAKAQVWNLPMPPEEKGVK